MATVPVMRTWVAGEVVTAAYMNANVRDAGNFFITPPSLYCYENAIPAALVTSTATLVSFDTNVYDTDTAGATHSTSTNPSRILPKTAGYHLVVATINFAVNTTGTRQVDVRLNAAGSAAGGTRVGLTNVQANGQVSTVEWVGPVNFNGSTDYIELFAWQNSGGNLALFTNSSGGGWQTACSVQTRWLNS